MADVPPCLGGEEFGINGKYFGVDHHARKRVFQLTASWRFESFPYSFFDYELNFRNKKPNHDVRCDSVFYLRNKKEISSAGRLILSHSFKVCNKKFTAALPFSPKFFV